MDRGFIFVFVDIFIPKVSITQVIVSTNSFSYFSPPQDIDFNIFVIFVDTRGHFAGKSVHKYAKYVCFLGNEKALKIGLNA